MNVGEKTQKFGLVGFDNKNENKNLVWYFKYFDLLFVLYLKVH